MYKIFLDQKLINLTLIIGASSFFSFYQKYLWEQEFYDEMFLAFPSFYVGATPPD